jgi:hypothetical protein
MAAANPVVHVNVHGANVAYRAGARTRASARLGNPLPVMHSSVIQEN